MIRASRFAAGLTITAMAALTTAMLARQAPAAIAVLTQRYDNARTGANLRETVLTVANVHPATFGRLFARVLPEGTPKSPGQIYTQPLVMPNAVGGRTAVFVATERNNVYAFDADDPAAAAPLWSRQLGPPVADLLPAHAGGICEDLQPTVGITGTPVIDPETRTLYVAAKTKESGAFIYRLHALDVETGRERRGSPVVVEGGLDAPQPRADGLAAISFDARIQLQRPGLVLTHGTVYLAFGPHCDYGFYHGWIFGYDAANISRRVAVFATTPNGFGGGIWHAGTAPPVDERGDLYVITGNGSFEVAADGAPAPANLSNAFIHLARAANGSLAPATWFTPFDAEEMDRRDLDLGSAGPMLLPGTSLVIGAGKQAVVYLVERDRMGGSASGDAQVVQRVPAGRGPVFGGLVYWKGPAGALVYLWASLTNLMAFPFDGRALGAPIVSRTSPRPTRPGGILSLSANGDRAGTGILWATTGAADANHQSVAGTLRAFDATNISRELWNSDQVPGDRLGLLGKFTPPTVVNGKVYVTTHSNQLVVYGLLPTPRRVGDGARHDSTSESRWMTPEPPAKVTWSYIYDTYFRAGRTAGRCGDSLCHGRAAIGGFQCASKDGCYRSLVEAGLLDPAHPDKSRLADPQTSPLRWVNARGTMPSDTSDDDPNAARGVLAWIRAGAIK